MLVPARHAQGPIRRARRSRASRLRAVRALALHLLRLPVSGRRAVPVRDALAWIENVGILGENGITLHLGVDGIAAPMVLLNGHRDVRGHADLLEDRLPEQGLLHPVHDPDGGVFGMFVSLDLFFLFFFYELAVLPMYLLIAVWGSSSVFPTSSGRRSTAR